MYSTKQKNEPTSLLISHAMRSMQSPNSVKRGVNLLRHICGWPDPLLQLPVHVRSAFMASWWATTVHPIQLNE